MENDINKQPEKALDRLTNSTKRAEEKAVAGEFERAVHSFTKGDDSLLSRKEFLEKLPHHILESIQTSNDNTAFALIERLEECVLSETVAVREKALMVIAVLNNLTLVAGNFLLMRKLALLLIKWLEIETVYLVGFAVICQQLQRIGLELIRNDFRQEAEALLEVTGKIEDGTLKKNAIIKNMVSKIKEQILAHGILEKHIQKNDENEYFAEEPKKINKGLDESKYVKCFHEFRGGDDSHLHRKEFVEKLPHHIMELFRAGDEKISFSFIDRLDECTKSNNVAKREKALMVIAILNNLCLSAGNLQLLRMIFRLLVKWLENETVYLVGFAVVCQQLQQIALEILRNEFWQDAEELLEVIYKIDNGILVKNDIIKNMTGNIREYIASQDVLEKLVFIHDEATENKPDIANNIVKYFGRTAILFLLEKVVFSEDKEDCLKLMKLLPGSGDVLPVLLECLKNDPPWHVIKNVICLVAEIGDPALFNIVEPYLEYPDIRVQQQVLICINKMGGPDMLKRLKESLVKIDDDLKSNLVRQLGQYESEDLSDILLDLLFKQKDSSNPVAEKLQLTICVALRAYPYPSVVNLLKHFAKQRKEQKGSDDRIFWSVDETIKLLEPKIRHTRSSEDENISAVSFETDDEADLGAKRIVHTILTKAKQLVAKGDRERAGEFLFKKAAEAAREKDFQTAEMLSDKILHINPNALPKLIRVGEIIEQEKSSSITGHHLEIWNKLYEDMTTEEFNAFYFSMRNERYNGDEVVVNSGETDPCLYFINSGIVRMTCQCGDKETFLKRLQPGDVAGVEQFFSSSVWTVSLIAQNLVRLQVLGKNKFNALTKEFPDIESKIRDFCVLYETIPELIRMSGNDRREFARYEVSVLVSSILLDPYGSKGKRAFKGEMIDISRGGLSFYIRVSKKENVKLLLGKQIQSEIRLSETEILKCHGVVVGAKFSELIEQDISVHVKLYRKIDQAEVIQVTRLQS